MAFGLLVTVFIARGFGVEAKSALASITAIIGLGEARMIVFKKYNNLLSKI